MELRTMLKDVDDRRTLTDFLRALQSDFIDNNGEWQHATIDQYIDGIARWLDDNGDIKTMKSSGLGEIKSRWQFLAVCLLAAKYYE